MQEVVVPRRRRVARALLLHVVAEHELMLSCRNRGAKAQEPKKERTKEASGYHIFHRGPPANQFQHGPDKLLGLDAHLVLLQLLDLLHNADRARRPIDINLMSRGVSARWSSRGSGTRGRRTCIIGLCGVFVLGLTGVPKMRDWSKGMFFCMGTRRTDMVVYYARHRLDDRSFPDIPANNRRLAKHPS